MTHTPLLALTFDDQTIPEWVAAIDLFKSYAARATFFISGFPHIETQAAMLLHKLLNHGHEIGYHSVGHQNAVKFLETHDIDTYVKTEILPGVDGMKLFGFTPESFAYPFNARTSALDAALTPYFKVLRARADSLDEALAPNSAGLIKARSFDTVRADGITLRYVDDIIDDLRTAARLGRSIALYGHGISDTPMNCHHMTLRGLDYLLWSAKRLGFQFVTAAEFAAHAA